MTKPEGTPVLGLLVWAAVSALGLAACGDSGETPEPQKVTAAEARDFYGMNPGSCWRYRLPDSSQVTVSLEETEAALTGYRLIKRSYVTQASSLAEEQYFDFESTPGEVRLLREVTGFDAASRSTKTFVEYRPEADREGTVGPGVLYFALEYTRAGVLQPKTGSYTTATTPLVASASSGTVVRAEAESHEWTRLGEEQVATPDGMQNATLYNYARPGGRNARYALVSGFGYARLQDFDNVTHQVCAARVCKSDGTCTGAASCLELTCP